MSFIFQKFLTEYFSLRSFPQTDRVIATVIFIKKKKNKIKKKQQKSQADDADLNE